MNTDVAYGQTTLPAGIRSRFVENNNGCTMHMLEAGFEGSDRPCVVLLHGFPEFAYSWRNQMLPLAEAGFHVVAPDLRGYGRSCDTNVTFDEDLQPFAILNCVSDSLGLVQALGYRSVAAIVGHDYGSSVAAWCALVRPDVFRAVALMSAPFGGPPPMPSEHGERPVTTTGFICVRASSTNWLRCRNRASITKSITRRARRTKTCGAARKASTISCALIST